MAVDEAVATGTVKVARPPVGLETVTVELGEPGLSVAAADEADENELNAVVVAAAVVELVLAVALIDDTTEETTDEMTLELDERAEVRDDRTLEALATTDDAGGLVNGGRDTTVTWLPTLTVTPVAWARARAGRTMAEMRVEESMTAVGEACLTE